MKTDNEGNNIIHHSNGTIIFNGGDPLDGCPKSYDEADEWAKKANAEADEGGPTWNWDCGFKLDYDGGILNISSRFYPPKTHYGPTWDGSVTICYFGKDVFEKTFDCKTLDELRSQVESFVKNEAMTEFIKWYNKQTEG